MQLLGKVGLEPIFCFGRMYKQNQNLVKLLEPVISAMGYEMLGIEMLSRGKGSLLRIYIDSEEGVMLVDCEQVSRQVTGVLDVHDPITGAYDLEISSPGFDRPLFTLEHFRRFKGFQAKVKLKSKLNGRINLLGEICSANKNSVVLQDKGESYEIPPDMIEKAHLVQ